jgi:tetratricopeptide (TPR) repeat protein
MAMRRWVAWLAVVLAAGAARGEEPKPDQPPSLDQLWQELDYSRLPAALEAAIRERPEQANLHYQLGAVRFDLRQIPEADQALERAVELDPKHVDAWVKLGQVQWFAGHPHHAAKSIATALELQPEHPDAKYFDQFFRDIAELRRPARPSNYPEDSPEAFVERFAQELGPRPRQALEAISDAAIARTIRQMGGKTTEVSPQLREAYLKSFAEEAPGIGEGMAGYRVRAHSKRGEHIDVPIDILQTSKPADEAMEAAAIANDELGPKYFDRDTWSVLEKLPIEERRAYLVRTNQLSFTDVIEAHILLAKRDDRWQIDDVMLGPPPGTSAIEYLTSMLNAGGAKVLASELEPSSSSAKAPDPYEAMGRQIGRGLGVAILIGLVLTLGRKLLAR